MFGRKRGMDMPAFGDAHFATREELERAGLLGPKGIRLGYYRSPGDRGWGRVIRYNGDSGLILIAPPRRGQGPRRVGPCPTGI